MTDSNLTQGTTARTNLPERPDTIPMVTWLRISGRLLCFAIAAASWVRLHGLPWPEAQWV